VHNAPMSCNAWNHPPGCDCGWGGVNHGRSAGPVVPSPLSTRGVWLPPAERVERETRPSACPHCGADVFFFRDENGGAAFFDKLGPPWPKHPCFEPDAFPERQFRDLTPRSGADSSGAQVSQHWPSGHRSGRELSARILAVHHDQGQQTLLVETREPDLCFLVVTDGWADEMPTLGFIQTSEEPGRLAFRSDGHSPTGPILTIFGPCFSVFDLSAWQSKGKINESYYAIAHDLSEGRLRKLNAAHFKPEWRFALRLYVEGLRSSPDPKKMCDVARIYTRSDITTLTEERKKKILIGMYTLEYGRLNDWSACYQEMLDTLENYWFDFVRFTALG
jgi:hypothetical protein